MKLIVVIFYKMPIHIITSSNESLAISDKHKSLSLMTTLGEFNIDHVFCSPGLFCLQSILPFCWNNGLYTRIEYSLHDFVYSKNDISLPSEDSRMALCMLNGYKSFTKIEELELPETEENRKERVLKFYNYVKSMFSPTSTVLLVTHNNCLNILLEQFSIKSTKNIEDFTIISL